VQGAPDVEAGGGVHLADALVVARAQHHLLLQRRDLAGHLKKEFGLIQFGVEFGLV